MPRSFFSNVLKELAKPGGVPHYHFCREIPGTKEPGFRGCFFHCAMSPTRLARSLFVGSIAENTGLLR